MLQYGAQENKDPQTILVSSWHPRFSTVSSILKNNFYLISADPKLSKVFKKKPTVTYRKSKSLPYYLLKIDIANQQLHSNLAPCGKWKLCPQINTAKLITNDKLNITEKTKGIGKCKEREIIYAAQCPSTRSYIFDIAGNNFQSTSPNIATISKTGRQRRTCKTFSRNSQH